MRTAAIALALAALVAAGAPPARAAGEDAASVAVEVHGFVDASYAGNVDLRRDTFGVDQAEVDLTRSDGERWALRADLEWVKDGDDWVAAVEQGYLDYMPPGAPALTFTVGRFNAPIGFELLDPPDMYQFSHALVFDYGLPSNLTGLMVAATPGKSLDIRGYVVNGWDNNDLGSKGPKTAGGRVGWSFGNAAMMEVSALSGSQDGGTADDPTTLDRTVFDLDVKVTPVDGLVLGAEANHGTVDVAGSGADWTAFMVMAHRDFCSWAGLTGRFDWFDDPDAVVFEAGIAQTRTAITVAPTFVLGDGLGALVEVRMDQSSEDVFADSDGAPKGSTTSVAFEVTGSF